MSGEAGGVADRGGDGRSCVRGEIGNGRERKALEIHDRISPVTGSFFSGCDSVEALQFP